MNEACAAAAPAATDAVVERDWLTIVAAYRHPDISRSVYEIAISAIPFVVFWIAAYLALDVGYWLTLLLAIPAAGFVLRLFLIQHDCGHLAFFKTRAANDWVGRVLGVFTMTPYEVWRRSHATHHATSGNLDKRGIGDIDTLTVREFLAMTKWQQLRYRLYRHPLVMFGIGPAYIFFLHQRLPFGHMREGWRPWLSAMGTNLSMAVLFGAVIYVIGWKAFVMVHVPIVLIAATAGIWMFYVQHQFEDTYWAHSPEWSHQTAALLGSSYYELPKVLQWFTANIGIHHVHHLYSRIPYYRLPEVLRDHPELASVRHIKFLDGFKECVLKLWDEEKKKLVPYSELRASGA
jgi:omega-6 fatty acid desaturase (delta-12 desaturase)